MEPATFGRYEAVAVIGEGAMGTVWRARDPQLGREVAVKTIKADLLRENPALKDRFEREARIVARLHHPRIVQIHDFGGDYLVMELLRGAELKQLLKQGRRFSPAETAGLVTALADALDHAHALGVVHRDLKPANLFIDPEGRPKITDFGIAKLRDESLAGLTAEGQVLGTPTHMSPEQITGAPVDGRSDQFSLAVIAYQLLAGGLPFPGDTLTTIAYKIVHEPPPDSGLGGPVDDVLRRAMAKEPGARFPDCRAFARALEGALAGAEAPPPARAAEAGETATLRIASASGDAATRPAPAARDNAGAPPLARGHYALFALVGLLVALGVWRMVARGGARRRGSAPAPAASAPPSRSPAKPAPAEPSAPAATSAPASDPDSRLDKFKKRVRGWRDRAEKKLEQADPPQ